MPLLDKACRPVTADEDKRIRQERMTEPPVFLESELSLFVDERIAIEEAEASSGERPTLPTGLPVARPLYKQFLQCYLVGCCDENDGVVAG